ncbi:uncharacterized protein LOC111365087 [Spodoptera litura]|uniref:Uncharacterized protein LOC111365087 n=1 Tax=Spodoptera litura TaxID=69820 RepID=A0A9J7ESX6_SPOLT|nr:uncharacterized protein LOC111365087 [Spodoptera litura]
MKILDDITLCVLFQLICYLNDVHSSFEDSIQEMDDTLELDDSGSEQKELKHSHHHHHLRLGHHHRKGHSHEDNNEDYDDCDCSCSKCDAPSECCKNVCKSCASNIYQQQASALSGQSQASVVFVPYPYPLMVASPMMKSMNHHPTMLAHAPTTQSTTTTAAPITTTATAATTTSNSTTSNTTGSRSDFEPSNALYLKSQNNENVLDSVLKSVVDDYTNIIVKTPEKSKSGNNKYMLTSLRRTKPTWMPKFGIVPISDDMAVKLMSQLRARYPIRAQKRPMHDPVMKVLP